MMFSKPRNSIYARVTDSPPENGCRPSADYTFRSAAEVYEGSVLGVVLTGMGRDGERGCELLRNRGASIFAQDAESSVVYGMPKAVAEAGLADRLLSLGDMPRGILNHLKSQRL